MFRSVLLSILPKFLLNPSHLISSMPLLCLLFMFAPAVIHAKQPFHGAILQYQHVNTTTPPVTSISPALFEQHLALIQSEGFLVLPLDVMIHSIKLGIPFERKVIAITFDDNYRSIYDHAFPLLKHRKWPFTIFVNPKTVRSNGDSQFNLSWGQLAEMKKHGASIANHSQDHFHLLKKLKNESNQQWKQRIKSDIQSAQDQLEKELGKTPRWLAYPYGEFDHALKDLLKEMDFFGFSQQSGAINENTNWQSIPRFPASGVYSNMETLSTKINSRPFIVHSENPVSTIRLNGSPVPPLELTVDKHNVIYSQLACYFLGKKVYSETELLANNLVITAQADGVLPFGRSRYNCTAPAKDGHYFWYSMPFISIGEQGQWLD
jgi:peptidoglycan/xylan/chitin deacetylase (PgdA/CDA1 family)